MLLQHAFHSNLARQVLLISPALLFLETAPGILDKTAIGAKYCVGIGDKKNEELFHQMIGDVNDFLCGFSALGKELK